MKRKLKPQLTRKASYHVMTGTLLLDDQEVYDPREINYRLLLGLQGTMSEFELAPVRQRTRRSSTTGPSDEITLDEIGRILI